MRSEQKQRDREPWCKTATVRGRVPCHGPSSGCSDRTGFSATSDASDPTAEQPEGTGKIGRPLAGPPPNGWSGNYDVGTRFTDGQLIVFNLGRRPLRMVSVRPELMGDGLRFLGARLAGLDRSVGSVQFIPQFPPAHPELGAIRDLKDAELPPGTDAARKGFAVLLGYEVISPGRSTVKAVEITYLDGKRRRKVSFTSTLALCTPATRAECPPEHGDYKAE